MITSANIVSYDGYNLIVRPHERIGRELAQKQVHEIELRIVDGRTISAEQRRKIYAIIRDIAFWCGDNPEWIKEYFKFNFCGEFGIEYFSLSDCEKSVARDFISYLIDFCFYQNIGTRDTLLNVTDDTCTVVLKIVSVQYAMHQVKFIMLTELVWGEIGNRLYI